MFSNNKISVRQFQSLFVLYVFATGILVLPRTISQIAEQDGWILIILSIFIAIFFAYIINSIAALFPDYSFIDISKRLFSAPIGYVLSLIFALKLIFTTAMELRIFGEICNHILLKSTPAWTIYVGLLLICGYLAAKGPETTGRISEVLIFFVLIPVFFVFIFAIIGTDFTNLAPVGKTPLLTLLRGSLFTSVVFSSIEFVLFLYPLISNKKEMKKGVTQAIIFIGLVMLFISVITIARLGVEGSKRTMWPVLQMMNNIDLPGAFIERQDALIMSIWIIATFISLGIGIFISSQILDNLFVTSNAGYFIIPVVILIFIIAQIPQNIVVTYRWLENCKNISGIVFVGVVPFLLLLIAQIKKEKRHGEAGGMARK